MGPLAKVGHAKDLKSEKFLTPPLGTLRQSLILILLSFFQKCPTNKNRDHTH
jgi:hypothetical protein